MLAESPIFARTQPGLFQTEDGVQYRPEKDLAAFKSIMPPEIEFVEGSSAGALAVPDGRYEPINAAPKTTSLPDLPPQQLPPQPRKSPETPVNSVIPHSQSLYSLGLDFTWPDNCRLAAGLYNSGNSCFMNSALQCLLHTPPLLNILWSHKPAGCNSKSFCMTCSLRTVAHKAYSSRGAVSPSAVGDKLQVIAKHMRRGRQEDSHEFLRYAIDALQKSCLTDQGPKVDPKLAETTWVHKLFGGRLRSRVSCKSCGYNSDTFDSALDLSLDIYNTNSVKAALKKFIAPDYLKGSDKYKCEKCKKHVDAEKRFSIHEAPVVLTIHLKRFSPLGRKIGHEVHYDEQLSLVPYMSEGQYGPNYSLYGVVCHAGGGPNSGHYYAFVKAKDGSWHEMNDESVSRTNGHVRKSAYMLFYIQSKGQRLDAALHFKPASIIAPNTPNLKKRKNSDMDVDNDEEDRGVKLSPSRPFIGPLLPSKFAPPPPPLSPRPAAPSSPSDPKRPKLDESDPQAESIKRKIQEAKKSTPPASTSMASLADYGSDSEIDQTGKENIASSSTITLPHPQPQPSPQLSPSLPAPQSSPTPAHSPPQSSPPASSPFPTTTTSSTPIFSHSPTLQGTPGLMRAKGRLHNNNNHNNHHSPSWKNRSYNNHSPYGGGNPYGAGRMQNSLMTYGKKRAKIRGV